MHFWGCKGLTSITIPGSVTSISDYAFYGCTNLTIKGYKGSCAEQYATKNNIPFVALEGDVEETKEFTDNGVIYEIKTDENGTDYVSVKGYEGEAKSLEIPSIVNNYPVKGISDNAFSNFESLEGIKVSENSDDYKLDNLTFATGNFTLKELIIPNTITYIGKNAFSGCTALSEITLTESIEEIETSAFSNCENVIIKAKTGTYAEQYAKDNSITFVALDGVVDIILGDINDDGVVSAVDMSTLIRYILCDEETIINKANSDINSDGKINAIDLLYLKRMFLA